LKQWRATGARGGPTFIGACTPGARARTAAYEGAREKARRFVNAQHAEEIVFVRGATEAINLVARSYGDAHVGAGDEVIVTAMEHHSNIVPWQMLCERVGARLRVVPVTDQGELQLSEWSACSAAHAAFGDNPCVQTPSASHTYA